MINSTLVSFLTLPEEALIRLSMDYIVDVFNTDVKLDVRVKYQVKDVQRAKMILWFLNLELRTYKIKNQNLAIHVIPMPQLYIFSKSL